MIKPQHIKPGDTIISLSLSRGGPGACPERYNIGKKQLEQEFDVKVIEGKYTLESPERVYNHPEARAEDLMNAFKNPDIKAIISSIGGEESIRILPYIDFDVIRNNPKIFMGFSDSTITHFICHKAELVSFYGPAIMAGFGENGGLFPYMVDSVKKTIFSNEIIGEIKPNEDGWTSERLERSNPENQKQKRRLEKCTGRRRLQGKGVHQGETLGGCIDVFPFMQGTSIWPSLEDWKGKVLILEPSEEQMPTYSFERIIRNLGSQGILNVISGILVGRAQLNYETNIQINYDETILNVVNHELGLSDLPIITNMDFGHTDPILTMPLGCKLEINGDNETISFLESACN